MTDHAQTMLELAELRENIAGNITLFSHHQAMLLELVDTKIAALRAPAKRMPADVREAFAMLKKSEDARIELAMRLGGEIEKLKTEIVGLESKRSSYSYCFAHQGPIPLVNGKCPLCTAPPSDSPALGPNESAELTSRRCRADCCQPDSIAGRSR